MNAKILVVVICVEVIIYLLLHNLHDCTFNCNVCHFPLSLFFTFFQHFFYFPWAILLLFSIFILFFSILFTFLHRFLLSFHHFFTSFHQFFTFLHHFFTSLQHIFLLPFTVFCLSFQAFFSLQCFYFASVFLYPFYTLLKYPWKKQ